MSLCLCVKKLLRNWHGIEDALGDIVGRDAVQGSAVVENEAVVEDWDRDCSHVVEANGGPSVKEREGESWRDYYYRASDEVGAVKYTNEEQAFMKRLKTEEHKTAMPSPSNERAWKNRRSSAYDPLLSLHRFTL